MASLARQQKKSQELPEKNKMKATESNQIGQKFQKH